MHITGRTFSEWKIKISVPSTPYYFGGAVPHFQGSMPLHFTQLSWKLALSLHFNGHFPGEPGLAGPGNWLLTDISKTV